VILNFREKSWLFFFKDTYNYDVRQYYVPYLTRFRRQHSFCSKHHFFHMIDVDLDMFFLSERNTWFLFFC